MTSKTHITNYSPFGVLLQNREFTSAKYRYGFNGQEKDDELKGEGNSLNFKYRMHDPRLGRFFAVDPLAAKYAYNSPYAFSENRVIDARELEGLEMVITSENNIMYGPIRSQGIPAVSPFETKDFNEITTEDGIQQTIIIANDNSYYFRQVVSDADLFNGVVVNPSARGTGTYSTEDLETGEMTVNVKIRYQQGTPPTIYTVGRVTWEFTNVATEKSGSFAELDFQAARGHITKEEYIKGKIALEAEAAWNMYLVQTELGYSDPNAQALIPQEARMLGIDLQKKFFIENFKIDKYENGTAETETGIKSIQEAYGEQYEELQNN